MGESRNVGSSVSQAGRALAGAREQTPASEACAEPGAQETPKWQKLVLCLERATPVAQSSGSQEPAGNHDPHAGRHHPGLTVPLNPSLLVLLEAFCFLPSAATRPLGHTHRSCTVGQGCHPASIQLGSQASPAPWAARPLWGGQCEGAARLGTEVAHSRPL